MRSVSLVMVLILQSLISYSYWFIRLNGIDKLGTFNFLRKFILIVVGYEGLVVLFCFPVCICWTMQKIFRLNF